jgi:hypothetical protein
MKFHIYFAIIILAIAIFILIAWPKNFPQNEKKIFSPSWPMFKGNFYRSGNFESYSEVPRANKSYSFLIESNQPEKISEKILDKNDTFDPSPIFVDLDGDGIDEVITYFKDSVRDEKTKEESFRDMVVAMKYTGISSEKLAEQYALYWRFLVASEIHSSFGVSDLEGDGKKEIIFGSDDGNLYVLNEKGDLIFTFKTNDKIQSSPAIEDIDFDGKKEIIFGSDDSNLYVLNEKGDLIFTFKTNDKIRSSPTVLKDSTALIVFGSDDGNLYVLGKYLGIYELYCTYSTGSKIRSSPLVIGGKSVSKSPIKYVVEYFKSGRIIFGSDDGNIYIINLNCDLIKKWKTNGRVRSSPTQLKNGLFALGSEDGNIYFFNESYIENISLGSPILSTPVSLGEKILAANIKGGIYLLSPNQKEKYLLKNYEAKEFSCSPSLGLIKSNLIFSCIFVNQKTSALNFFIESIFGDR